MSKILISVKIAEGSGRALEFSRHFGARAHQTQRSGPAAALPSIADCEELLQRQERVLSAINRIRGVVVAQEHAMAEQRNWDEAKKVNQTDFPNGTNGYQDKTESTGFAGDAPKKPRGSVSRSNVLTATAD